MKITARQQEALRRLSRLLLCLSIGLSLLVISAASPAALASTSSRATVTQAVMQETLPELAMKPIPAPETLQAFTKQMIGQLSANAPFKEWKDAATQVYPLGPGTRSWLVNVMNGGQRIGYLIISAADDGSYLLSEYGAGTDGLPYSMNELHQYLVQQGLISANSSGKIKLTALYAPLLPVWELKVEHKTVYLNASVLEVLPWTSKEAERVLSTPPVNGAALSSGADQLRAPLPALLGGGQDDPYADLLWLTAPALKNINEASLTALLQQQGSLAFQSAGHNDTLGAPFMITGSQRWLKTDAAGDSAAGNEAAVVYAAAGPGGLRFLPLGALQHAGTFHVPPAPCKEEPRWARLLLPAQAGRSAGVAALRPARSR
ncbi:hypothetical protein [Paenibacillus piscarius]|uniref:hypothetical protein n=1 Tax=Paenibacillus piscarius TaxID=1089681 RepID=UPI001EE851BE|nr:hypothetical protein [Paenibacillus piscarius]